MPLDVTTLLTEEGRGRNVCFHIGTPKTNKAQWGIQKIMDWFCGEKQGEAHIRSKRKEYEKSRRKGEKAKQGKRGPRSLV